MCGKCMTLVGLSLTMIIWLCKMHPCRRNSFDPAASIRKWFLFGLCHEAIRMIDFDKDLIKSIWFPIIKPIVWELPTSRPIGRPSSERPLLLRWRLGRIPVEQRTMWWNGQHYCIILFQIGEDNSCSNPDRGEFRYTIWWFALKWGYKIWTITVIAPLMWKFWCCIKWSEGRNHIQWQTLWLINLLAGDAVTNVRTGSLRKWPLCQEAYINAYMSECVNHCACICFTNLDT